MSRETDSEMKGAQEANKLRPRRPHRNTTARIEEQERRAGRARPLLNDETMAGQQKILDISRQKDGVLTVLDSPVPTDDKKREADPRLDRSNDREGVTVNASDLHRARYSEILRLFHAGKLIGKDGAIVTQRHEAKAIAADEARLPDAIS